MTITTIKTVQLHAPSELSLQIKTLGQNLDEEDVLNLAGIVEKYATWKDPYSLRLFKWCAQLICAQELEEEEAIPYIQKRLLKLFDKIFANPIPLGPQRLRDPVLANNRVWEKSVLELFQAHMPLCFFDNQSWDSLQPHGFAVDIAAWAKSLPAVCHVWRKEKTTTILDQIERIDLYQIASIALANFKNQEFRKKMKMGMRALGLLNQQQGEINHMRTCLIERQAQENLQQVKDEIKALQGTYEGHLEILHAQISEEEKKRQSVEASLEKSQQNIAQIEQLLQQERDTLRQLEDNYQKELKISAETLTQSSLAEAKSIFESQMEIISERLTSTDARLRNAYSELVEEQRMSAIHTGRIHDLEGKLRDQESKISHLSKKAKKSSCEIM